MHSEVKWLARTSGSIVLAAVWLCLLLAVSSGTVLAQAAMAPQSSLEASPTQSGEHTDELNAEANTVTEIPDTYPSIQDHNQPGDVIRPSTAVRAAETDNIDILSLVAIGWISSDGVTQYHLGFIQDATLGQTYTIVRYQDDARVVRRWIPPYSPLVHVIPWEIIGTQFIFPVEAIGTIPLDHRFPEPNMLARRFDGNDVRIFAYDAELQQWRHIPDWATFQAMGFFWCNVTAADAGFFERITIGPPFPASGTPERDDYPNCQA